MTGARDRVATGAEALVRRIRAHTTLPIALGFGISRPEHVAEVGAYADAAVVGSALVVADRRGTAASPDLLDARRARTCGGCKGVQPSERACATLDDLRTDIDRVDEVLVRLLNERARVRAARSAG